MWVRTFVRKLQSNNQVITSQLRNLSVTSQCNKDDVTVGIVDAPIRCGQVCNNLYEFLTKFFFIIVRFPKF